VPELSKTEPDAPVSAAFEVANVMDPVVLYELAPLKIETDPPVCVVAVVAPADSSNAPPDPLPPVPTTILIAPPDPLAADPEYKAR